MARLTKNGIKIFRIIHYITVSCWVGSALVLLLLNIRNDAAVTDGMLLGMNTASHLADTWVIVPGAMGCLLTGLIFALFTPWGFFKHKWLTFKWLLTVTCILVGVFFLGVWENEMLAISRTLGNAALTDSTYQATKAKHFWVSCAQIAALLLLVVISVFKPWKRKTG